MINPQTFTQHQEKIYRDQTFYFLKKYTGYTYLSHGVKYYQVFVDGYNSQLKNLTRFQPEQDLQSCFKASVTDGTYKKYYSWFLDGMAIIAKGLKLFRTTPHKMEAYKCLRNDRLHSNLTGRKADLLGTEHDPFLVALGMRPHSYNDNNELVAAPIEGAMLSFYERLRILSELDQILLDYSSTSYNYLLEDRYFSSAEFPSTLPPCPGHNSDSAGQIWSDRVIPVTGIREPWFAREGLFRGVMDRLCDKNSAKLTGKVGCPNYFLAGTKAYNYRLDNRQQATKHVAWRLLWQDGYLDGEIPEEKAGYLYSPTPIASPKPRPYHGRLEIDLNLQYPTVATGVNDDEAPRTDAALSPNYRPFAAIDLDIQSQQLPIYFTEHGLNIKNHDPALHAVVRRIAATLDDAFTSPTGQKWITDKNLKP